MDSDHRQAYRQLQKSAQTYSGKLHIQMQYHLVWVLRYTDVLTSVMRV
jgi:hypothetical protein